MKTLLPLTVLGLLLAIGLAIPFKEQDEEAGEKLKDVVNDFESDNADSDPDLDTEDENAREDELEDEDDEDESENGPKDNGATLESVSDMKTTAKDDSEDGDINDDEENFGVHQSLQKSADPFRIRFRRIGRCVPWRRIIRGGKRIIRRGKRIIRRVCRSICYSRRRRG